MPSNTMVLATFVSLVLLLTLLFSSSEANLIAPGFYNGKCGNTSVEQFIFNIVKTKMQANPGTVGDLTRLSFHDCFVRGCDASIMIDGSTSEKTAPENLNLDGFDDIDDIKTAIEGVCPGVVSCADILVMATRDTINIAGGNRYVVETGRRDGLISRASDAANVPGANILMTDAIKDFANIGLTVNDLVVLLGAHTVGVAHCNNFQDRLYNFSGTGKPDPTMDPALVHKLVGTCPSNLDGTQNTAFLDQTPNSQDTFDRGYFNQILVSRGVTKIDSRLATDPRTKGLVQAFSRDASYSVKFGQAMVKMTRIGVLTGTNGEIRKKIHGGECWRSVHVEVEIGHGGRFTTARYFSSPVKVFRHSKASINIVHDRSPLYRGMKLKMIMTMGLTNMNGDEEENVEHDEEEE